MKNEKKKQKIVMKNENKAKIVILGYAYDKGFAFKSFQS